LDRDSKRPVVALIQALRDPGDAEVDLVLKLFGKRALAVRQHPAVLREGVELVGDVVAAAWVAGFERALEPLTTILTMPPARGLPATPIARMLFG
jgi:hypothetical protein